MSTLRFIFCFFLLTILISKTHSHVLHAEGDSSTWENYPNKTYSSSTSHEQKPIKRVEFGERMNSYSTPLKAPNPMSSRERLNNPESPTSQRISPCYSPPSPPNRGASNDYDVVTDEGDFSLFDDDEDDDYDEDEDDDEDDDEDEEEDGDDFEEDDDLDE